LLEENHPSPARFPNGEPAIEASRAMFNAYPQDIRMWLQAKGGVEKMPLESLWLLFPSELWQMGYRQCETLGTMPGTIPPHEMNSRGRALRHHRRTFGFCASALG
jgi:hypothetical protein